MLKKTENARKKLDERLAALRPAAKAPAPNKGWVKAIREALGMTQAQLGRRLSVSQQTVDAIENSENSGAVQLSTLRRVAEALDATLVYAIVPNSTLEHMVNSRARTLAIDARNRVAHTMRLEDQETGTRDDEAAINDYIANHIKERDLWSDP